MNILVVDDDRVARFLLHRMLQSEFHCQIIEAADGLAAWELLQGGLVPDLCLLDIMMPRMDGLELLQRIRTTHRLRCMPVIMCTTVQERSKYIQATSLDIDDYLRKPFTQKRVVDQVRKALRLVDDAGSKEATEVPPQPSECERGPMAWRNGRCSPLMRWTGAKRRRWRRRPEL
jgi:two-component system, chemotaxis family, chemotaxis protein CheY